MWLWIAASWAQDEDELSRDLYMVEASQTDLEAHYEEQARTNALLAAIMAGDLGLVRGILDGTVLVRRHTIPVLPQDPFALLARTGPTPTAVAAILALQGGSLEMVERLARYGGPHVARALADTPRLPRAAEPVMRALLTGQTAPGDLAVVPDRPLGSDLGWAWQLLADAVDPGAACWALTQRDAWLVGRLKSKIPDTCDYKPIAELAAVDLDLVRALGDRAVTPCGLQRVAQDGNLEVLDWLLDHGADARQECPNGAPVLIEARTEEVVVRLLQEGLDPFDDAHAAHLRLASNAGALGLPSMGVALAMLQAETAWPERREQGIVLAWLVGGPEVEALRPYLPEALGQQPPGTLPDLDFFQLERAWTLAGGLEGLLAARGSASFGDPIPAPCDLPRGLSEAKRQIGETQRRDKARNHRVLKGTLGQVDEWRNKAGPTQTEGWALTSYTLDASLCPELVEMEPLLPVLVGRVVRLQDGRVLELHPDPNMSSKRVVRVVFPQ